MGTRINYEIGDLPSVILYSNSHHDSEDPVKVFRSLVKEHGISQTGLTRALLNAFYKTPSGSHKAGDGMFSIDLEPGDREQVLRVTYGSTRPRIQAMPA
jgi:hypothetical protein